MKWPWVSRHRLDVAMRDLADAREAYLGVLPNAHAELRDGRVVIPRRFLRAQIAVDVLAGLCVHGFSLNGPGCLECRCAASHPDRTACGVCGWAAGKYPKGLRYGVPGPDIDCYTAKEVPPDAA